MIAERIEAITDVEGKSLAHLLKVYQAAVGKAYSRPLKLKLLSHLIGRDISTSRQIMRHEYERVCDSAAPRWREGDWTHSPAFAAFAMRLAAGYALVVKQEQAAYKPPQKKKRKSKKQPRKPQQNRRERARS